VQVPRSLRLSPACIAFLRCLLGLLLVVIDQMDERLGQGIVDLTKAMKGKTEEVQAGDGRAMRLQLIDGKTDKGRIVEFIPIKSLVARA